MRIILPARVKLSGMYGVSLTDDAPYIYSSALEASQGYGGDA